jgi:hypothetical protein
MHEELDDTVCQGHQNDSAKMLWHRRQCLASLDICAAVRYLIGLLSITSVTVAA